MAHLLSRSLDIKKNPFIFISIRLKIHGIMPIIKTIQITLHKLLFYVYPDIYEKHYFQVPKYDVLIFYTSTSSKTTINIHDYEN